MQETTWQLPAVGVKDMGEFKQRLVIELKLNDYPQLSATLLFKRLLIKTH